MNYVSLFSGIGGLDLGLDRAGMQCAAQVERDPYCLRVLAKHWPGTLRFDDVRTFGRHSINGTVDLVCGGFPCQPFSNAGQQRGAEDDRNLWPEMRRVVQEFQPRWVLGENVTGFIGLYLDTVLSDLGSEGYEAQAVVLPAVAFDAPHIRKRVFVIAYSEGQRSDSAIAVAYTHGQRCEERDPAAVTNGARQHTRCPAEAGHRWQPEPAICRVADGVSHRVDRLRGLGNAVVPQVAEHLGRLILEADRRAA